MDISLVELVFFGFVELFSIAMLIASTIREVPTSRSSSLVRAIFLIPGFIAAIYLSGTGVNVELQTLEISDNSTIKETTYNATTNTKITNSTTLTNSTRTETNFITLQDPVWITFHFLIAAVIMVYVIIQILSLFTKTD